MANLRLRGMSKARSDAAYVAFVSVKNYGATGDGTTDDTVAVQAAITAAQGFTGGGTIYFPAGVYKITDTLLVTGATNVGGVWNGGISFRGAGTLNTRLSGPTGKALIQLGATGGSGAAGTCEFRDLWLQGQGKTDTGSLGIDKQTTGGTITLQNLIVQDFATGIRWHDVTLVSAQMVSLYNCGTGLAAGYYSDCQTWENCRFAYCDTGAWVGYYDGARTPAETTDTESHATIFSGCQSHHCGVVWYITGSATESITLDTCYAESYNDRAVRVGHTDGSSSVSGSVRIRNPYFMGGGFSGGGYKADHAIEVNNENAVNIDGGGYRQHTITPLYIKNSGARVTVLPANFDVTSGETGAIKLWDGTLVAKDAVVNEYRLGTLSLPLSIAAALPSASAARDGARLRLAGTTYECGSDGVGGYSWYAQPTAKRANALVTGGSYVPSVFMSASALTALDGSPTLGVVFTRWKAWALADAASNGVGAEFVVPADWATVDIKALWSRTDAATGNVAWVCQIHDRAVGADMTAGAVGNTPIAAVPAQNILASTTMMTGQTVTPAGLQSVRLYRDGANASDTYTGTAQLLGILITKAS